MALKPFHDEVELLKALASGDEKAFNEIFYATHQQIGDFIFSITKSLELSEEIVYDVFLKIWTNRKSLSNVINFHSYLFILTRNHTLNVLRKLAGDKRRQELYEREISIHSEEGLENLNHEYEQLLETAVSKLPPQQQKVFLLRQQGFKNTEVADQMHISPDSVKKYQQWALQSITRFIKSNAALTPSFLIFFFF